MAYDKKKSQQVSIRIPHDLWRSIKAYYTNQGIKRLSKNAMVVMILDKWMIGKKERIGEAMIRLAKMTEEEARKVLRAQEKNHKLFGELAVEMGIITQQTLDDFLDEKGKT